MTRNEARRITVTRRQAVGAGATLAVGAAVAAVPDVADAQSGASVIRSVTLAQAKRVLDAAERHARELGVPMYLVVVDAAGIQKAARRMDGNSQASVVLAPLKAQTANGFRTPTHVLARNVAADPTRVASIASAPGFTLLPGGVPLRRRNAVVGAIGVGGGSPDQDVAVAEAGAAALT